MTIQDFLKVLRTRWLTIAIVTAIGLLVAVGINSFTTPVYRASTRLFVSANSGTTANDIYQGNPFSQERVLSYADLIVGANLAQRTIDKMNLNMTADDLRARITAVARPNPVLIDVSASDESPSRASDIANTLSDEFVVMVRELETPENGLPPDSRVVVEQRASIPKVPVAPAPRRNIAMGFAIGMLLGICIATFRHLLDNTVKDRQAVEAIAGVGMVGSIPLDKDRRLAPAKSFEGDNSAMAEAFRKLRTNLQFLVVDSPPRVLLVTSPMPNEGKSTTAINIALALAEAEQQVVIVDGDLRQPRLDSYFGVVGSAGLSTVLAGRATLIDVLQSTRFPGVTVLTSGAVPPNPSELLGSLAAKNTIRELRGHFDYVIIDSPPLLAVTDSAILAATAEGVLIVTRFGQTKREQLGNAVGYLEDVGAPLIGAVLTMTPLRGNEKYSYKYAYVDKTKPKKHSRSDV